ncbi:MAG TPA: 4-(cytidine 5'-diphospho)-2-C-methyl-D-erythritol kinase [Candidatus Tectomicrobia bacterium]|nr:4-(cytidine 5'-diphospho)-2-C-methyl-D-erythritol kinase [Candidatus Tectomicrobia bacterium]
MTSFRPRFASPAKVNFGLRILGKRLDGYHAIQTIFQMLDLCDWLSFRTHDAAIIRLTCIPSTLAADDSNLVVRAAKLLQQAMRVRQGVEITLEKHIPIAAGLGGGSSNAATTLLVLNSLWKLNCPMTTLQGLAAQLGSDVPFFLNGPTALAGGRGEALSPISPPPLLTGVLVNPGFGVSAGWAYEQFNGQSSATDLTMSSVLQALWHRDLSLLADVMVNDLEPGVAAVYPVIRQARRALGAVGALATFMSGSGPTVGGLFPPTVDLQAAMTSLRSRSPWTVVRFATLSQSFHPELRG